MERVTMDEQSRSFQADGVACLPGLFRDWVETIGEGVERNMSEGQRLREDWFPTAWRAA